MPKLALWFNRNANETHRHLARHMIPIMTTLAGGSCTIPHPQLPDCKHRGISHPGLKMEGETESAKVVPSGSRGSTVAPSRGSRVLPMASHGHFLCDRVIHLCSPHLGNQAYIDFYFVIFLICTIQVFISNLH